jgi:hypothetical protein
MEAITPYCQLVQVLDLVKRSKFASSGSLTLELLSCSGIYVTRCGRAWYHVSNMQRLGQMRAAVEDVKGKLQDLVPTAEVGRGVVALNRTVDDMLKQVGGRVGKRQELWVLDWIGRVEDCHVSVHRSIRCRELWWLAAGSCLAVQVIFSPQHEGGRECQPQPAKAWSDIPCLPMGGLQPGNCVAIVHLFQLASTACHHVQGKDTWLTPSVITSACFVKCFVNKPPRQGVVLHPMPAFCVCPS